MTKKKSLKRPPTPEDLGEVFRATQLKELDRLKTAYEGGKKIKLLEAAAWCGKCGLKMPTWVAVGIVTAFEKYSTFEVRTLEEAFDIPPRRKGIHIAPRNEAFRKSFPVYLRTRELWTAGCSLGDDLFNAVGKEFGINGKKVETYFYRWRELIGPPIRKVKRPL